MFMYRYPSIKRADICIWNEAEVMSLGCLKFLGLTGTDGVCVCAECPPWSYELAREVLFWVTW